VLDWARVGQPCRHWVALRDGYSTRGLLPQSTPTHGTSVVTKWEGPYLFIYLSSAHMHSGPSESGRELY
jgi:hypothetical protein